MSRFDKIFETETRFFQLFNACLLIMSAIIFGFDGSELYEHHIYQQFKIMPLSVLVPILGGLGVWQFFWAWADKDDYDGNIIAGYALVFSSVVWFFMGGGFITSYPPLNLEAFFSFGLAVACWGVSERILPQSKRNKYEQQQCKKCKKNNHFKGV